MTDKELAAIWSVLQTEAEKLGSGIKARALDIRISGRGVMVGTNSLGHRLLLIPLSAGEAFAEDRSGRSIHLLRIDYQGYPYLGAICLEAELNKVFAQFVVELLQELSESTSPARDAVAALARWRLLLASAPRGPELTDAQLIGLLAELLVLEQLLKLDDKRRVEVWTGPDRLQHDFRCGIDALEVKATLAREGLFIPISSVHQLEAPPNGSLHLVHLRFEPHNDGESLPSVVDRITALGVEQSRLARLLTSVVGTGAEQFDVYQRRRFKLVEQRVYDARSAGFPKVLASSFVDGALPPGVLRLHYDIDLTNEPPSPLSQAAVEALFVRLASWS